MCRWDMEQATRYKCLNRNLDLLGTRFLLREIKMCLYWFTPTENRLVTYIVLFF